MDLTFQNILSRTATRIAPTPSGFLHLGNVLSFAITAALAEQAGAAVWLRIDDLDQERARPAFVKDIFETLTFLDIPWRFGPRGAEEFSGAFSQLHRMPLYEAMLQRLRNSGEVYGCDCSRGMLAKQACKCADRGLSLDQRGIAWRLRTPVGAISYRTTDGHLRSLPFPASVKDVIIRRKDGFPSYQVASVCDDLTWRIDMVVRGLDLLDSTLAQQWIAACAGEPSFAETCFCHHMLLTSGKQKLSKSSGDESVQYLRKKGCTKEAVWQLVADKAGCDAQVNDWRGLANAVRQLSTS